jgi:hypothetical protein
VRRREQNSGPLPSPPPEAGGENFVASPPASGED